MLKKMFRNAFYYIIKPSPITEKKIKTFSYGKFLLKHPEATKIERKKSIKEFVSTTRKLDIK